MNELLLHIETSTKICSVALSEAGKELARIDRSPEGYIHGESLTLFISELLHSAQRNMKDLDAVSVSIGPGSYTGLRIGLSTAKGICFGLGLPIIGIPTLDILLNIARHKYQNVNLCAMLDARRMEVYTKSLDEEGSVLRELSATIIEEDTFLSDEPFVYFGDGADKLSALWKGRNATLDSELQLSAAGQIDIAVYKYRQQSFEELSECKPLYLKQFGLNT